LGTLGAVWHGTRFMKKERAKITSAKSRETVSLF